MTCGVFAQEELAEGLHLIDFEQLKIENQTYNEKIEERNEVLYCLHQASRVGYVLRALQYYHNVHSDLNKYECTMDPERVCTTDH